MCGGDVVWREGDLASKAEAASRDKKIVKCPKCKTKIKVKESQ